MKPPWVQSGDSHEFTAVMERAGDGYIAWSPEIPGANGQGRTKEEARQSLAEAIARSSPEQESSGRSGLILSVSLGLDAIVAYEFAALLPLEEEQAKAEQNKLTAPRH